MNQHDSIIVYRSRQEQMFDEWYWDAIEGNPESILLFMQIVVGLIVAACLVWVASKAYKRFFS